MSHAVGAATREDLVHWKQAQPRSIAILDPFPIERRLLVALAQSQGHRVIAHQEPDDLLPSLRWNVPDVLFAHLYFEPALRRIAQQWPLPPVVLIDSCSIGRGEGRLTRRGNFTALRFPIGLQEFAEAVGRIAG
jgi:hypothetical protein